MKLLKTCRCASFETFGDNFTKDIITVEGNRKFKFVHRREPKKKQEQVALQSRKETIF